MRRRVAAVFAVGFLGAAGDAMAEEFRPQSTIAEVTVYPRGAEVTRTLKVTVPAGSHVVVLEDLPGEVIANSVRVEGQSRGALEIGSVDTKRVVLPRETADNADAERKRIEDEIKALEARHEEIGYQVRARETQRDFVTNLAALPTQPAPSGGASGSPREDWSALAALIGTAMGDVQGDLFKLTQQTRAIETQLEELRNRLADLAPKPVEQTVARINVIAGAEAEADLVVRYQVQSAGWQPLYDARLGTGSKDVAPALAITRRAAIRQSTTEAWRNVVVRLSTVRPTASSAAPELGPLLVDFRQERPPAPVARRLEEGVRMKAQSRGLTSQDAAESAVPVAEPMVVASAAPVAERAGDVSVETFQATFRVPETTTIDNSGEVKRVRIESQEVVPELLVRAVPQREARAFLYAKLELPKGAPFLAGEVALFRDNTFVGTGRMPQKGAGEGLELGFGVDDQVRVKFAIANETRGETGIISSTRTDQRDYTITLKNLHERAIAYSVVDRVPVSLNQEIKVDFNGSNEPTRRDVEDKRGVVAWEAKLEPGEEKTIRFGYRISWPAAKEIEMRR